MLHLLITILEQLQNEESRILKARHTLMKFRYTGWAQTDYLIESIFLDSWSQHWHAILLVMLLQAKEPDDQFLLEEKLRSQGRKNLEAFYKFWYSKRFKRLYRDNERSWKAHRQTQHK